MKTIRFGIEVTEENCTGCYRCERVCPTEAMVMVGPKTKAIAVVDNDKCVACMRCIDACDDDALHAITRDEPLVLDPDHSDVELDAVGELCRTAGLDPSMQICTCSETFAQDVAAQILEGATSYEELALSVGVQSGCLMYCSIPIYRLLSAATGEAKSNSQVRRYSPDLKLIDIPAELDEKYPMFNIGAEQRQRETKIAEMELDL